MSISIDASHFSFNVKDSTDVAFTVGMSRNKVRLRVEDDSDELKDSTDVAFTVGMLPITNEFKETK